MSCLALALQPINGPDLLLQTREWFPPARALIASSKFRAVRNAYAANGKRAVSGGGSAALAAVADDTGTDLVLGDEALAAAGGQVVVGKESKYRVVYRLVNIIYVLGIAGVDQDSSSNNNIFDCARIVNQAVSVLVAACKGVDVTADKVGRKYTEIYMAMDVVLRGISTARLSTILATIHGEGVAQIVRSATDAENRARGAESWGGAKAHALDQLASADVLAAATFELPEETLAAGDELAATLIPPPAASESKQEDKPKEEEAEEEKNPDPFAASDRINKPEQLVGGFKKNKDIASSDVAIALAGLEVAPPPANAAEAAFVGVEGFEGDYGGLDFGEDGAMFGGAFEGLGDAFGGGLDASEFGAAPDSTKIDRGLAGLEELEGGGKSSSSPAVAQPPTSGDTKKTGPTSPDSTPENKHPCLYLSEEIHAEFCGSKLVRIGLQGSLYIETGQTANPGQDITFSFRLEGGAGIKKALIERTRVSSLGRGLFHLRTPPAQDPLTILKYRLHPRFTPVPLRMRLVTRQSGSILSFMIQYVANPFLPGTLKNVTFIVPLPSSPTLLKMSPKGSLNRHSKELRWDVGIIDPQAGPGQLRAQMPIELDPKQANGGGTENGSTNGPPKLKVQVHMEFSYKGHTLSGITVVPATDGKPEFYIGEHTYKGGHYLCS